MVSDPHHLNADSGPAVTLLRIWIQIFTLMRIRIQLFSSMRIRILLLIKVMLICDRWSTDLGLPLSVHGTPWLHCEPRKLLNFFILMRIWIQLFTLMRIRIQLPRTIRIWIRNPGCFLFAVQHVPVFDLRISPNEIFNFSLACKTGTA
jgi:hypothetical protein